MKRFMRKLLTGILTGCMAFLMIPGANVNAAQDSYTVTYRPGNVGNFAVTGTELTGKKEMAKEAAQLLYGGNADVMNIQATDNGAIKLTVAKGAAVPMAPSAGYVKTEAGYFTKNTSEWGPAADATVTKNIDFVADYGKLVDGVEYSVRYIDEESEESVAPVAVAYGNIGDAVEITAPEKFTLSEAAHYELTNKATQSMVLSENSEENILTFTYKVQPGGIIINEVTVYEEGDTVVLTEIVEVPVPGEAGAELADGQGGDNNAGNDNNDNEQPDNNDNVNIEDEETPLTDTTPGDDGDDTSKDNVVIEDEEAPTAPSPAENTLYVTTGIMIALLFAISVIWIKKVRQAQGESEK